MSNAGIAVSVCWEKHVARRGRKAFATLVELRGRTAIQECNITVGLDERSLVGMQQADCQSTELPEYENLCFGSINGEGIS